MYNPSLYYYPLLLLLLFFNGIDIKAQNPSKKDSVWIKSAQGCKIYNPHPLKQETITWTGDCQNGYASGTGTLTWFKKGIKGDWYKGRMEKGSPEGIGIYYYHNNQSTAQGLYKSGKLNGPGEEVFFDKKGDTSLVYTGDFIDRNWHGKGRLKTFYDNGYSIYEGDFKDNKQTGEAELWFFENGQVFSNYKGSMKNGKLHGFASQTIGNSKYIGNWYLDNKKGQGKLYFKNELIYTGEWKNNHFSGLGKRYFPDGSSYYGHFKKDMKHGFGILKWKNGKMYIGEFQNGLFDGHGYITSGNGGMHYGIWEKGSLKISEMPNITLTYLKQQFEGELSSYMAQLSSE